MSKKPDDETNWVGMLICFGLFIFGGVGFSMYLSSLPGANDTAPPKKLEAYEKYKQQRTLEQIEENTRKEPGDE